MTLSSNESRGFPLISADFQPPSSSSSSSESSPLAEPRSAIDDNGGIADVPECRLLLTPWDWVCPESAPMSGERMESESDSFPETAETLDGYFAPEDMSDARVKFVISL